ncbi:MAG TPA: hypothetical protein V6C69_17685 [Trichormus sp.]
MIKRSAISHHSPLRQAGPRSATGNMLALICASILLMIPLAYFGLEYVRMTGANQEQRTAIEAAAMAAAKDIGRIVVDDPNEGFISISDYPPSGTDTKASDNYFCEVRSINTILATARIDMIIADQLNSNIMRAASIRDYQNAMQAKDRLMNELNSAILAGGKGTDIDGKAVAPYNDAVDAYNSNLIKMDGNKSSYVPGSLLLSLGWEKNLYTTTAYPQPISIAQITSTQRNDNDYASYVDVPFTFAGPPFGPAPKYHFVFYAIDSSIHLVDFRAFLSSSNTANLPYLIPSIVKAEADQQFIDKNPSTNTNVTRVVHSVACAEPASLGEHLPAAGALAIDFPTGTAPGLAHLIDIFQTPQIMKSPTDLLFTPPRGDSPPADFIEVMPSPLSSKHPPFANTLALGMYDWIRRCGTTINVKSLVDAFVLPFSYPGSATDPHAEYYQMDLSGNINHFAEATALKVTRPVTQDQIYARSGITLIGVTGGVKTLYDVYIKDYVNQPGRTLGGVHAGESMGDANAPMVNRIAGIGREIDELLAAGTFPTGPGNGAVRPTYQQKDAVAVDILVRGRAVTVPAN